MDAPAPQPLRAIAPPHRNPNPYNWGMVVLYGDLLQTCTCSPSQPESHQHPLRPIGHHRHIENQLPVQVGECHFECTPTPRWLPRAWVCCLFGGTRWADVHFLSIHSALCSHTPVKRVTRPTPKNKSAPTPKNKSAHNLRLKNKFWLNNRTRLTPKKKCMQFTPNKTVVTYTFSRNQPTLSSPKPPPPPPPPPPPTPPWSSSVSAMVHPAFSNSVYTPLQTGPATSMTRGCIVWPPSAGAHVAHWTQGTLPMLNGVVSVGRRDLRPLCILMYVYAGVP